MDLRILGPDHLNRSVLHIQMDGPDRALGRIGFLRKGRFLVGAPRQEQAAQQQAPQQQNHSLHRNSSIL